jgi:hypothetical protein
MIDFNTRLKSLKDRRQGTREMVAMENNLAVLGASDYRHKEDYEKLPETPGVKYAIGSMSPVDPTSTKVSVEEGERVADTLISSLRACGINATRELQGSVALDIHIKGHSDVDMLVILSDVIRIQTPAKSGIFYVDSSDTRSMVDIVSELRFESEKKLCSRYPQAKVDCSNGKSISMQGGSLRRKIDIVPSCWYDNHTYQISKLECDRGISIYNKKDHELITNLPFTHIKKVDDRDLIYTGNLKRVARLLKNMVADMPVYKKEKAEKLSSYDIAAIAYNMDGRLNVPGYLSLGLVELTNQYLSYLINNPWERNALIVPDGSRNIFDKEEKVEALGILQNDIYDLTKSIYKELRPYQSLYDSNVLRNKKIYM